MKITKIHVGKYIELRSEVKECEEELTELKGKFLEALRENGEAPILTAVGKVQLVKREVMRLDEAKLLKALGLQSLEAFKTAATVESVMVTAK